MTKFENGSTVSCRLNGEEWTLLQTHLRKHNLSASQFIRECLRACLGGRTRLSDFDESRQTSVQSHLMFERFETLGDKIDAIEAQHKELIQGISKLAGDQTKQQQKLDKFLSLLGQDTPSQTELF